MRKATRRVTSRRLVAAVLLVCLLGAVLVAVGLGSADAQTVSDSADAASSVRIAARKLDNGNIEFGLQVAGGEIWLPPARFFAYATVDVGRWLRASPYGMSDGNDVRVRARKLANGKVEFALQVGADRQWLPAARNFPYDTATVGRWLYASTYTVGDPTTPLDAASPPATGTTAPPDASSCTFERTMSQILPAVFQVVVTTRSGTGAGTAFYVGDDEFLTAAHVVAGARTIRLQNHERTFQQVQVAGVDTPSDLAILRADGAGVPAMRFGDVSLLGRGATVAVVGYPLFETDGAASIVSGLLSAKWRDNDHEHITYLQTDAAANPGNSGGPLISTCGEVIGLVSWKVARVDVEGVVFAVTEATVQEVMPRARQQGRRAATPAELGAWRLDAGAGRSEPHLINASEHYEYEDASGAEEPPALVITCRAGELAVFVWWDSFLAANLRTGEIAAAYRFDDGGWVSEGWYGSVSFAAAFARSPRSFVGSALRADELTIRVENFDGESVGGAVFQLAGLEAGLRGVPCY